MARGPYPKRNARKRPRTEPVLDHVLQMSIDKVNGEHDPETGHYGHVVLTGLTSKDHAAEIIRAMYRSARYMEVSLPYPKVRKSEGGGFELEFFVVNSNHARRFVNAIPAEKRSYNQHIRSIEEK